MDLSCIISSGDLELYVLGALPQEEAHQIGQLALLFPEVRSELDAISEALEAAANSAAATLPAPSANVKSRIMASIRDMDAAGPGTINGNAVPIRSLSGSSDSSASASRVIAFPGSSARKSFSMGIAASVAGLLLCGAGLVYALKQNSEQRKQVATLEQTISTQKFALDVQRSEMETYASLASYMQRPGMEAIRLMPVPNMPQDAMAQIFWDKASHEVMVANLSLPDAPAGMQYQLWAIVDGKPVDAGMLSGTRMKPQLMKTFASAQAFAITLEHQGGSPAPTMTAMYVMGKTS